MRSRTGKKSILYTFKSLFDASQASHVSCRLVEYLNMNTSKKLLVSSFWQLHVKNNPPGQAGSHITFRTHNKNIMYYPSHILYNWNIVQFGSSLVNSLLGWIIINQLVAWAFYLLMCTHVGQPAQGFAVFSLNREIYVGVTPTPSNNFQEWWCVPVGYLSWNVLPNNTRASMVVGLQAHIANPKIFLFLLHAWYICNTTWLC